jgi:diacylglycerol kinase (ATP)
VYWFSVIGVEIATCATMFKTLIIYNPKANRGRNLLIANELQEYIKSPNMRDTEVAWVSTQYPKHATELAAQSVHNGCHRVVSMGGDGTLHEITNGLMQIPAEHRPQLGIVPMGSGNDFVMGIKSTVHINPKEPRTALENVLRQTQGETRAIDIGYISLGDQPRQYWCNALGIGFDAAVTLHSLRINWLRGQAMYFLATVRTIIENYDAPLLDMNIDGIILSQRVQMLTIGNGTREGGGFITTPAGRPDDGMLNYAMFEPMSRLMMVRLIPEVMQGTHGKFRQVRMGTMKRMQVRTDPRSRLLVHADGEMVVRYEDAITNLEVGVIPGALSLVC